MGERENIALVEESYHMFFPFAHLSLFLQNATDAWNETGRGANLAYTKAIMTLCDMS